MIVLTPLKISVFSFFALDAALGGMSGTIDIILNIEQTSRKRSALIY